MVDPTDFVLIGGGGLTVGGLLVKLLTGLGSRSINALDETIKGLRNAVEELRNEVRHLRETDIAQAKDIGAVQQELKDLRERINGIGDYWRAKLEAASKRGGK